MGLLQIGSIDLNFLLIVFLIVVITQQPTSFSAHCLDPASQGVYNSLTTKHMSGHTLVEHANDIGNNLIQNVQGKFVSIKVSQVIL